MKLPPLENLKIFEAVARLHGFSAAAEELSLSHSAVSRRVSELEARLGVRLLQRTSRRVALTPAGEVLFQAAREGLRRIAEAAESITRTPANPPLLVSCERSLAMRWLIPRLSGFQDANPGLPVYLSTGGGAIDFGREGVDLAIRRADFPLDAYPVTLPLFPEYVGPVATAAIMAGWTADAPLTRLHTTGRRDAWARWAQSIPPAVAGSRPPHWRDQYFDHFFLSVQAAEAGLGVAIAPLFLAVDAIGEGKLAAPHGFVPDGTQYVALARRPVVEGSPESVFLTWLRSSVAETLTRATADGLIAPFHADHGRRAS